MSVPVVRVSDIRKTYGKTVAIGSTGEIVIPGGGDEDELVF